MERETKIKLSYRVALVSGIFCGVVALLLILNFWHMKQHEPLESKTIEALVERLRAEPNNQELKEEIRSFDLLARKAYFTSRWQVKTGTWLLLVGGIVLAVSLKSYTDLRARIEEPEAVTEELLRSRANAQYWLFLAGGLVLGLAMVAAWFTNDYLKEYQQMAVSGEPGDGGLGLYEETGVQPGVEVIEVVPADTIGTGEDTGTVGEGDAANVTGKGTEAVEGTGAAESGRGGQPTESKTGGGTTRDASGFNRELLKRNQATFRGYMGQGISYHKNIPVDWDGPSGRHVRWKVALIRPGYNSPVIWDDKLFVSGADNTASIVACYNRNTGQLLWEKEVKDIPGSPASPPKAPDSGLAAPTMAVDGKRVCAIFATGDVVAFDLNGNKIWGRNLGVPSNHYGHSSSLQVWEDKLVVQYDTRAGGRMLALETSTGETIWDVSRPVQITWASPVLIELDGKIQIVTSADPYVSGHDLETGEELWKVEAMMGEVGPSVAYDGGLVYASQEYARTVAIRPGSGAEIVWEDDEYMSEVASPVAHNGLMFLASMYGVLVCYDGKTGEKQWEKEFDNELWSSPAIAEGKLYMWDKEGIMHIMKADRTGEMISEPVLGEPGYAQPVFADGVLYLRGTENLYCIGK